MLFIIIWIVLIIIALFFNYACNYKPTLKITKDERDDIKECPWCGPDGIVRYGDGEKICPECGGSHIYKSACRGNECEDFGCEIRNKEWNM